MSQNTAVATPSHAPQISDQEFQAIRRLVYDNFGINLTDQKKTLVVGRLQKVLRQRGFSSFKEYFEWVTHDSSGEGLDELANRISTNHTFFYRENAHFQFFADTVLPEMVERRQQAGQTEFRIWCAGCSSGEEPYTLMMIMKEFFGPRFTSWKPLLLATDISASALKTAMAGVYEKERVGQLPPVLKNKYFRRLSDGQLIVTDDIKREIHFRRHNTDEHDLPLQEAIRRHLLPERDDLLSIATPAIRSWRSTTSTPYPGDTCSSVIPKRSAATRTPYRYVMPAVYRKAP